MSNPLSDPMEEDENEEILSEDESLPNKDEIVHPDTYYYGEFKTTPSKEQLVEAMTNGLVNFYMLNLRSEPVSYDSMADVLDRWFEHDAKNEQLFDHLVPEDQFDDFAVQVVTKAEELVSQKLSAVRQTTESG